MKKVLYISGTRADYGLMQSTLRAIDKSSKLELEIVATGMHLMKEFGTTINEIKKDGFKVHTIKATYKKDNKESMAKFVGEFIQLLSKEIKKIKPDMILVLGDRGEMLAGAIVGAYMSIPVVHIHGGEMSYTTDGIVRHAITKLSDFHFSATKKSAKRIIKMGEASNKIFVVGAPGLDDISDKKIFSKKDIAKKYSLDLSKLILLVVQHAVSEKFEQSEKQIKKTMEVIKDLGYQSIIIYPNADAGGREIIKIIEQYRKYFFIQIYKSISRKDYLSLMNIAGVMVGNSSSGIIEAPSFHLPVVNIGLRQKGRERAKNIIDVNYDKEQIKSAIKKALFDDRFKKRVENSKNPYADGRTSKKIVKILNSIKINKKLLEKN